MALDLNERLVIAVTARLNSATTGINAAVDAVNARTTADPAKPQYTLVHPLQVLDAAPVVANMTQFPIIAIIDGPMTFVDDVGWGATGEYIFTVAAFVSDPDPRALAWKLRRYAQAIMFVVMAGRTEDGGAWGMGLRRIQPGPRLRSTDPTQTKAAMSYIACEFWAKDEQDTP